MYSEKQERSHQLSAGGQSNIKNTMNKQDKSPHNLPSVDITLPMWSSGLLTSQAEIRLVNKLAVSMAITLLHSHQ